MAEAKKTKGKRKVGAASRENQLFTYKARIHVTPEQDAILSRIAKDFCEMERRYAAALLRGMPTTDFRNLYKSIRLEKGFVSKYAGSALTAAQGKIDAAKEARKRYLSDMEGEIKRAQAVLKSGKLRGPRSRKMTPNEIHHKKRRLISLQARHANLKADDHPKLTFGSSKLFKAQFRRADILKSQIKQTEKVLASGKLGTNEICVKTRYLKKLQSRLKSAEKSKMAFNSHEEWREAWQKARSKEFMLVGRNADDAGNDLCRASFDGQSFALKLRVSDTIAKDTGNKHLHLTDIHFHNGAAAILYAISPAEHKTAKCQKVNAPVTWRFVKPDDGKGWLVYCSTHVTAPPVTTRREAGAIGVDFNADHIAVSEIDCYGNPLPKRSERLNLHLRGKTQNQRRELIRVVAKAVAENAREAGKPVVVEKLDFAKKKQELESVKPRYARMLSALVYSAFGQALRAACFRAGVEVIEVNPAYTSIIGAVNYASKLGISVHLAAAIAIARRGLSCSENAVRQMARTPDGRGSHVAFALPERNRAKHVWSHWSLIRTARKTALKGHFQALRKARTTDTSLEDDGQFLLEITDAKQCVNRASSGPKHVRL